MHGSMISIGSSGIVLPAYLALPETEVGAGLIVVQEWWGLTDHIKSVVDRFAEAGFVTLAPDPYHGAVATSPDDAAKLAAAFQIDTASSEIRAAAEHLHAMPQVNPNKVGVVGFCMGGQLALYAAIEQPDLIAACVDFYGSNSKVSIDPVKLQVPVLAHFGKDDPIVVGGGAARLVSAFSNAGKFVDVYYYDAGHAFFNDCRADAYNPVAAALAWDRTLAFLRDNLR